MKKIVTLALLLFAFALAACGGSETTSTESSAGPVTLDFQGQDIAFDKTSATANAGQSVTVNFSNVGSLEHNWILVSPGVDPLTATQDDALSGANSEIVAPGATKTFTFTAPPAGDYTFVCTVEGHAAAGMIGTLTVQ
ncbi:MAG: plastocyanin/azurin family copper-binding protein [Chloroflexi bacterium]|nr:plastocyanin/azurin family copper-binding protein [Chloroflexota bacterium]